jgi:ferritin-like metal-binding protein YciE
MKTTSHKSNGKTAAKKASSNHNGVEESKLMKLFENELRDIYWAEKALTKALPKMMKKAYSPELAEAFQNHLEETEGHILKVEEVFGLLDKTPRAKKCEAMDGLIREAQQMMEDSDQGAMRDAGIIFAAQKVEHYEIATYGTLRTFAHTMGLDEVAGILEEVLDEEKAADEKLTFIAETSINMVAAEEEQE